jgi:hypothetical protein
MFETPILYLIFNRLDLTEITFSSICKIKPKKLFIAADGPRLGNINDEINCKLVREYVISKIDWDCEVITLFREKNLGCGKGVSSAISWFFEQVDYGIILEDDCVPNNSFFYFCEQLLLKYKYNDRISHISGCNFQIGYKHDKNDYFFSNYSFIWGWATWKRSWIDYDFEMKNFESFFKKFRYKNLISYDFYLNVKNKTIDTWDVQWQYSLLKNKKISIQPRLNLIRNIGFSDSATHTNCKEPHFLKISEYGDLDKNLIHPNEISINWIADYFTAFRIYKLKQNKLIKIFINKYYNYFLKNINH